MYFTSPKSFLVLLASVSVFSASAKNLNASLDTKGLTKPLCFVENKGQLKDEQNHTRTDLHFKMSAPGLNLFLGDNNLVYEFHQNQVSTAGSREINISGYQVGVKLLGANPHPEIVALNKDSYHENYYTSIGSNDFFTAAAYDKVVYKNVYPGIDWVVYSKDGRAEYDFVIKKDADPSQIKIEYDGAVSLNINNDGALEATTPMGTITEAAPVAFETETGKKVAAHFGLNGNILSFETAGHNGALTIDPYLNWSTYFGGASDDVATMVTSYGGTGLLYVAGYTSSTAGISFAIGLPFNTYGGGIYDAFLAGYSATGVLAWATYFGGAGLDQGTGIAADGAGALYLTGYTNSTGIGTPGTAFPTYTATNGIDAFLVKFNNLGVRQWSTYFGGPGDDYSNTVACDAAGGIYIAGCTNSTSNIATAGAFQTALNGANDGFFAKFTNTGLLSFGSYFGGSGLDSISSAYCDGAGNLVFTGQTNSNSGISTAGAYQTALSGTNYDAFVESFSTTGTRNWGTYFGGTQNENGCGIACDGSNNICVVGNTSSTAGIASANAFQSAYGGGAQDAFVAQFTSTGTLAWSTYYGGLSSDYAGGVSVDNLNNFGFCGYTLSTSGIASTGALQASNGGGLDAFVAKFDPLGRRFWGSFFGGTGDELANGITFDATNKLTFVGSTTSSAGMYSGGGMASSATVTQPAYGGGLHDGFVTQFTPDTVVLIDQPFVDTLVCAGGTLIVNFTTNSILTTTLSVQISDASGNFPASTASGIIGVTSSAALTGSIVCTIPAATAPGTGYRIRIISTVPSFISPDDYYNIRVVSSLPVPTITAKSPICVGENEVFGVSANYIISSYSWTGPNSFTAAIASPTITGISTPDSGIYYVAITHNGCPSLTANVLVTVNNLIPPTPTLSVGAPACKNYIIHLYGNPDTTATPIGYHWSGPGGFTSTLQNPTVTDVAGAAAGTYTLMDTIGGCPSSSGLLTVSLLANSAVSIQIKPTVPGDTAICYGDSVDFNALITNGGPDPVYQWMSGLPDTPIVGAMWNTWSSNHLTNGEQIYCVLTSDAQCAYPQTVASNIITMHIADSTPSAYITVSPDSFITHGETVTFYAYAIYPGTITVFQWYVDDTLVPGANASSFTLPDVNTLASVKLQVYTPAKCASPDRVFSNKIGLHYNTGVNNVNAAIAGLDLFPNPGNGNFTIKGAVQDFNIKSVQCDITDILGQVLLSEHLNVVNGEVNKSFNISNLSNGIYLARFTSGSQEKITRFTIKH